jgi:predicted amino acid-binding ACT domain protein
MDINFKLLSNYTYFTMDMEFLKISVVLFQNSFKWKCVVGQAPHYTHEIFYGNLQNEFKYEVHKLNQNIKIVRTGYTKSSSNVNGVCTYEK